MGEYTEVLKTKTDKELLDIIDSYDQWSKSYIKDVLEELSSRGVNTNELIIPDLSLEERRKICESCQHHKHESPKNPLKEIAHEVYGYQGKERDVPSDPDAPIYCGLTMKDPVFRGNQCPFYVQTPGYERLLMKRGIRSIIIGIGFIVFGLYRMIVYISSTKGHNGYDPSDNIEDVVLICIGIVSVLYAVSVFVKRAKYK